MKAILITIHSSIPHVVPDTSLAIAKASVWGTRTDNCGMYRNSTMLSDLTPKLNVNKKGH